MAAGGHFGLPKITFDCISRHFRSIRNFIFFSKWPPAAILDERKSLSTHFSSFQINIQVFFFWNLFSKWLPAAILDYRKSLSIAFLAISDQYPIFYFFIVFSKWPPVAILEVQFPPKKTIGFFPYVLSMAMPNMKLIGEFMTELENPQAF